ncbi:N-acetyltransferase [Actinoplanes lobatus]|uniref:N-acetyltransferase n=1 Tax=Actinoplanes lobatus TaxID=113568 RepID=A0A7W7HKJ1_9ACTN|nr:GNAT family N-acetyltransferase [Actinoplanes lobatus]MBB4752233.1 GNAT superfamily N-acetyltransferase [Actinoplanes lobatus]GGN98347.1 N-acetyltransferase [Actinoplanes lobatus]GIE45425.1 N-acetyltransferase [Actinoplanes lobatus]
MSVKIRRANRGDVQAIISVGRRTWPATYEFAGAEYIADGLATWWSVEAIERSLETTTVLVADSGKAVVGTGNIDLRPEIPVIWKLYAVPEVQGTGVGAALITELMEVAGGLPVRLEYTDGNARAAGFYARHGFVEIRREANDQPGWPDAVWLERQPFKH